MHLTTGFTSFIRPLIIFIIQICYTIMIIPCLRPTAYLKCPFVRPSECHLFVRLSACYPIFLLLLACLLCLFVRLSVHTSISETTQQAKWLDEFSSGSCHSDSPPASRSSGGKKIVPSFSSKVHYFKSRPANGLPTRTFSWKFVVFKCKFSCPRSFIFVAVVGLFLCYHVYAEYSQLYSWNKQWL